LIGSIKTALKIISDDSVETIFMLKEKKSGSCNDTSVKIIALAPNT
jgi:hypothetical protein